MILYDTLPPFLKNILLGKEMRNSIMVFYLEMFIIIYLHPFYYWKSETISLILIQKLELFILIVLFLMGGSKR